MAHNVLEGRRVLVITDYVDAEETQVLIGNPRGKHTLDEGSIHPTDNRLCSKRKEGAPSSGVLGDREVEILLDEHSRAVKGMKPPRSKLRGIKRKFAF